MAEGKLEPADFEDSPLPGAEAPDFDLSDETSATDGNGVGDSPLPEMGAQGEPEGIFALFDKEFPEETREPIDPRESTEFDREFSESFEVMFTAVKGDGSAPLFEDAEASEIAVEAVTEPSPTPDSEPVANAAAQGDEDNMLPIPGAEPKRQLKPVPEDLDEIEDVLPFPDARSSEPLLNLDPFEDEEEIPLMDPSAPLLATSPRATPAEDTELPLLLEMESEPSDATPGDEFQEFEDSLRLDDPADFPFDPVAGDEDDFPEDEANGWNSSEDYGLEELNFDDSDEDELFGEDLSGIGGEDDAEDDSDVSFDEFAKLALGFDDEEDDSDDVAEDDDFIVEELSGAQELDPFEDIAIMSSEDVAKFESPFGDEGLKFQEEEPLPEDPDPFSMDGKPEANAGDEEDLNGLDPFGEEAVALASAKEKDQEEAAEAKDAEAEDKEEEKAKKKKPKSPSGAKGGANPLIGILLFPWRIYSTLTSILFGLIEAAIGLLAKIPLIGIPFRILGSVLSAIPMALKRVIVLLVIAGIAWGGTSIITSFLPKPTVEITLPDSGGARFIEVELKDGLITGSIENTGAVTLRVFPQVQVFERKILSPGTWFNPVDRGVCGGDLIEIAIDSIAKVSYSCDLATDGIVSVVPTLKE